MKKGKFLSSLAAAALSVSMLFAPVASSYATSVKDNTHTVVDQNRSTRQYETNTVNIHKIVMNAADFAKFGDEKEHDGSVIDQKGLEKLGASAEEVSGVAFRFYKLDENGTIPARDIISRETFEERLNGTEALPAPNAKAVDYDTAKFTEVTSKLNVADGIGTKSGDNLLTSEGGLKITFDDGIYVITEDVANSTYNKEGGKPAVDEKGNQKSQLTGMKAIPTLISLPAITADKDEVLNIYPKNTEGRPEIDKNFAKDNTAKEVKKGQNDLSTATGEGTKPVVGPAAGAQYQNYKKEKARVTAEIGKEVPYEVKTKIPQQSNYRTLTWSDTMDNGLTLQKDSIVVQGSSDVNFAGTPTTFVAGKDYILDADDRGFNVDFTQAGLNEVKKSAKSDDYHIRLTYKAKVNSNAVADIPQKNDIKLEYNNNPKKDFTSEPVKPVNGRIDVEKKWADAQGNTIKPKEGTVVEYILINNSTKEVVNSVVLKAAPYSHTFTTDYEGNKLDANTNYVVKENVVQYTGTPVVNKTTGKVTFTNTTPPTTTPDKGKIKVTKTWAKGTDYPADAKVTYTLRRTSGGALREGNDATSETVTLKAPNFDYTFEGLQNENDYYVTERVSGYTPTYTKAQGNGQIAIDNNQNVDNPNSLNPTEPEVVNGGKRFVKADENSNVRLEGAKFVVKNEDEKYLTGSANTAYLEAAVVEARQNLIDAVTAYNKLEANAQTKEQRAKVDAAQAALNAAIKNTENSYTWGAKANAIEFESDAQGKFEVQGLAYGTYFLEETKAPDGYAKRDGDIEFTVEAGSYLTHAKGVEYKSDAKVKDEGDNGQAFRINNRSLSIPQTGGIGSLIFIVAGLALMGVAFVAMKRRNSYEEA